MVAKVSVYTVYKIHEMDIELIVQKNCYAKCMTSLLENNQNFRSHIKCDRINFVFKEDTFKACVH